MTESKLEKRLEKLESTNRCYKTIIMTVALFVVGAIMVWSFADAGFDYMNFGWFIILSFTVSTLVTTWWVAIFKIYEVPW